MSAIVKTTTAFTNKALLLETLDEMGVGYELKGNKVVTDRMDYYGHQCFEYGKNGSFNFQHDSSAEKMNYPWRSINFREWKTVTSFLEAVEVGYKGAYTRMLERLAEEERLREEERRKQYVESVRNETIERAKSQGYIVKETRQDNKIKLVLSRTTY
ncbi:hypothetical protein J7W08_05745 [Methanococcoides orientis]|uniref:hypothetical protein n=1 Tax=Methanococcoides orientis TaxID=2822137 RepID=UPI001E43FA17|nr:hypothetical protein [Methanococcoides orientis]UGV41776.1 hypothetical protein J7W08_05745 [Methanococcoides orientis]